MHRQYTSRIVLGVCLLLILLAFFLYFYKILLFGYIYSLNLIVTGNSCELLTRSACPSAICLEVWKTAFVVSFYPVTLPGTPSVCTGCVEMLILI